MVEPPGREPESLPSISVLLPVRNEASHIEACLASLAAQDYPSSRLEVLVIDGRSDDRTRDLAGAFARRAPFPVHVLDNPGLVTAAGLNLGLDEARGDLISYVLGHGTLAPDYLRSAVEVLDRTGADAAGGPIRTVGEGSTGEAIAAALSSPFGVGGATFRYGTTEQDVDTVAFPVYRRRIFERAGRFDEELVGDEDSEFHFRAIESGCRIVLSPALRATYHARASFRGLGKQYVRFGAAKAETLRRAPARVRPWHLAPAAFVACLAAGALPGPLRRLRRGLLQLQVTLYAVGVTAASLDAVRRRGVRVLPFVPAAFATIHFAYGAGSLLGLTGLWRPGRPR